MRFGRGSHGVLGNYRIESLEAGVSANSVPDSAVVLLAPPRAFRSDGRDHGDLSGATDSVRSGVSVEAVRAVG